MLAKDCQSNGTGRLQLQKIFVRNKYTTMTKKKGSPQVKWTNMRVVRIYSNVPFDMLFKYELDVGCTLEM